MLIKFKDGIEKEIVYLSGADLRSANLRDAVGNCREIKSLQLDIWPIAYAKNVLSIGCKQYTISEWRAFTDEEIEKMNSDALEWWHKWKEIIFKIIEMSPAE